jgi:hypothetical protein
MTPKIKPPRVPSPAAIPEAGEEVGEQKIKALRRKSGFEKTMLTGALSPSTGRRTTLG